MNCEVPDGVASEKHYYSGITAKCHIAQYT